MAAYNGKRCGVVSEFRRDPKGYYSMLGVSAAADAGAIKAAYRTKAKRLHPDMNPSPIAAKQFQRLTEAYEILSDPHKRTKYDESAPAEKKKAKEAKPKPRETKQKAKEKPQESERPRPKTHQARTDEKPKPSTAKKTASDKRASRSDVIKPEVCQCGKVTAQPRYVIFDMVSGQGSKLKRKAVAGVFCRSCADRAALKASYITWVAGWWAWPNGPKETVKALWNNIRGGRKPADRNTRLLVRQARAFRDRGDTALARGIAEQALVFARTPDLRGEVDRLLLSLSAHSAKHLKTRWDKPGWAFIAQLLPVIALVVWASLSLTMSTPVSITDWVRDRVESVTGSGLTLRLTEGGRAEVITEALNLRTGPGSNYQMIVILPKGAAVTLTEMAPGGDWARVTTANGETGFVQLRALAPLPDLP